MYEIQTTPGIILNSRVYGEADKVLKIFTRDLGLVSVIAKGIRLEKSKLRPFAADYSWGMYSLVRGRDFWRITDARAGEQIFDNSRQVSEITVRLAVVLLRFLHGEEKHPDLFECVRRCVDFALSHPDLSTIEREVLEALTIIRVLNSLGYVEKIIGLDQHIRSNDLDRVLLGQLIEHRTILNRHINKALKESQL